MQVKVIGSQFTKVGQVGDFGWMIDREEYADALFIFNDNEEQFKAYLDDPKSKFGCEDGANNAAIRHYRCVARPRAAGIPTGSNGKGYLELTKDVEELIEQAFNVIRNVLAAEGYERVIYSAANAQGDLGVGTFDPGTNVKEYIVSGLRKLED